MENDLIPDVFEAELNEQGRSALSEAANWGYINAIVGFISLAINIVVLMITITRVSSAGGAGYVMGNILVYGVSFILNLTLLKATQNLKNSFAGDDQGLFVMGLGKLATYFRVQGILTIIVLGIGAIALFVAIFANISDWSR